MKLGLKKIVIVTTGKGISSQLEDYPELLEVLDLDELDDLWDEMEYYLEVNE